jgi:hypothetical protein
LTHAGPRRKSRVEVADLLGQRRSLHESDKPTVDARSWVATRGNISTLDAAVLRQGSRLDLMELAMSNDSSGNPNELSSGGSRYHQVYPTLDETQLAILERYGERRKLKANDILYSEGDRHTGMFAIRNDRSDQRVCSGLPIPGHAWPRQFHRRGWHARRPGCGGHDTRPFGLRGHRHR